jgi:very-short-patch-repair endonuclease
MNDDTESTRGYARRLRRNMTHAETILWSQLRRNGLCGLKFRRQHPIGPFILDFVCLSIRLAIEVDGITHCTPDEIAYDKRRDGYLRECGFTVLRIWNGAIYGGLDDVIDLIREKAQALQALPPHR